MLMKTIILPTDFSENAANALHYAAALAAHNKSKLLLVHAIPVETITSIEGNEVALPPDPRLEVYYLNKLVEDGKQIRKDTGYEFEMEAICVHGSLPDNLNRLVRSKQADLVVMGTKGAHKLIETLLGTNTLHFIRQAVCPVLVIPDKAPFREIKRIAYAADFEMEDESVYLRQLLRFADSFCPQLYIINIQSDEQLTVVPDLKVLRNIETQFPENPFCIAQIREDDVVTALEDFVSENKIDILAIGIQKRCLLEKLFHRSISRQLAFHFPGPLLALPPYPYRVPVKEEMDRYSLPEPINS
jgi:nucleotide-binding universal stress UspA family protein